MKEEEVVEDFVIVSSRLICTKLTAEGGRAGQGRAPPPPPPPSGGL